MSGLILPDRFNAQPQYPARLDRSHPIGKLVTAAVAAHYDNGRTEMISGLRGTVAGALPAMDRSSKGIAARSSNTGSGYYWSASANFCNGSASYSVEFMFWYNGGSLSQYDRIWEFGGAGGNAGGWDIEVSSPTSTLNFVTWFSGANLNIAAITGAAQGNAYHVVITVTDTSANTSSVNIYVNGVLSSTTAAQFLQTTTNPYSLFASYVNSGSNSATGISTLFGRFYQGTVLNQQQVDRLFRNPWALYQAPRRIWSVASASSTITGTIAITEGKDVPAITGQVWDVGSIAITEGKDVPAITGTVQNRGTIAITEGRDVANIVGTITLPTITGTVAITEGRDRCNISALFGNQDAGSIFPLTRKQRQDLEKKQRKERKAQEKLWQDKRLDANSIAAEMREIMHPASQPSQTGMEAFADDDEDADIETLLLYG